MFFNLHCHSLQSGGLSTEKLTNELLNVFPEQEILQNNIFSTGIHPRFVADDWQSQFEKVEQKAQNNDCLAIGECGLDIPKGNVSMDIQTEILEKHIALSEDLQKPMVLHIVGAHQQIIALKKKFKPKQPWVYHGFGKKPSVAKMMLENDFYLSFGKHLFNNPTTEQSFIASPLEKLFLETDMEDLKIEEIYHRALSLKNIPMEELCEQLNKTVEKVFGWNNG